LANTTFELCDQRLCEDGFIQIKDVLNNIIAEWVLDQGVGVIRNLPDQPSLLTSRSMVNAPLEDTAAVPVSANVNTMVPNSIEYKLGIRRRKFVQTFLNDVVSIQVLNELNNSVPKSPDDSLDLARRRDKLDHLLQGSSSVLVQSDADKVMGCIFDEDSALFVIAILQKLLAEIIAERISHQLNNVLIGFKPDHVDLLGVAIFQFLLKVSTAVLVFAESIYLTAELFK
jgi:hypothetical protein